MNAPSAQDTPEEPSVAGVRVRPVWSIFLFVLLVASAALALYAQRANVDPLVAQVAPWVFLVFALGFTVYRVALVAARRYSPFKAFFQIFIAALFFMLLLFPRAQEPKPAAVERSLAVLVKDRDARVRAMAAELAGLRRDVTVAPALVQLLEDPSGEVRQAAHGALVQLNDGADLGPAEQDAARAAWKGRFP